MGVPDFLRPSFDDFFCGSGNGPKWPGPAPHGPGSEATEVTEGSGGRSPPREIPRQTKINQLFSVDPSLGVLFRVVFIDRKPAS